MPSLLLVSLGPIQDFIASARRCQDLWFGSWLLSELAHDVARVLNEESGGDALVFPASLEGPIGHPKPAVANKILVQIPGGKDVAAVAEAGRQAMVATLDSIAKDAFDRLPSDKRLFLVDRAFQQVRELMEYVWVAVPVEPHSYAAQRRRAETLLAARKATRSWRAVAWGDAVPKSSLDGLRESVLHEDLFDANKPESKQRHKYFVRKAERLCGVGLLKRLGVEYPLSRRDRRPSFHSTSHVASGPWRSALVLRESPTGKTQAYALALEKCGVKLKELAVRAIEGRGTRVDGPLGSMPLPGPLASEHGELDGSALYEGRLEDRIEQAHENPKDADSAKAEARTALSKFRRAVRLPEPTTYYALLLADGDNMGKVIDRQLDMKSHRALGAKLDAFSARCRNIVEEKYGGSLIYAGGDDVLALLPLHTALQCARALAVELESALEDFRTNDGPNATLSVGLAVAHHLVDFAEVREQARRAEKLAKEHTGKNALGIIVEPRGGIPLSAVGSWAEGNALDARVAKWCSLFHGDALPDKVAFALLESVSTLLPHTNATDPRAQATLNAAALSTIKRALSRRQTTDGQKVDVELRKLLEGRFTSDEPLESVRALSEELQIARYFLDAYALATQDARGAQSEPEVRP